LKRPEELDNVEPSQKARIREIEVVAIVVLLRREGLMLEEEQAKCSCSEHKKDWNVDEG